MASTDQPPMEEVAASSTAEDASGPQDTEGSSAVQGNTGASAGEAAELSSAGEAVNTSAPDGTSPGDTDGPGPLDTPTPPVPSVQPDASATPGGPSGPAEPDSEPEAASTTPGTEPAAPRAAGGDQQAQGAQQLQGAQRAQGEEQSQGEQQPQGAQCSAGGSLNEDSRSSPGPESSGEAAQGSSREVAQGACVEWDDAAMRRQISRNVTVARAKQTTAFETVHQEDIKAFRCSITARRFSRLQDLKDDQIRALIIADRKKTGRVLPIPTKTKPKSTFAAAPPRRNDPEWLECQCPAVGVPRWSPSGKFTARADSKRTPLESFLQDTQRISPYDTAHQDQLMSLASDESKRTAAWVPNSASQARDTVQVKITLTSKDEWMLKADKAATAALVLDHLTQYKIAARACRGTMLQPAS